MLPIELPNLEVSGRAPWESHCWCVARAERRWKLWGAFIRGLPCELVALGQESANISVEAESKHSRLSDRASLLQPFLSVWHKGQGHGVCRWLGVACRNSLQSAALGPLTHELSVGKVHLEVQFLRRQKVV